ncbi:MAG: GNAT family N-acetyltransferase [Cetobacterium sp.]|uniref:GNAT family N-acetyltransferase n=1 Tax=Cetobacterium sp. TaxID=2071632 RepID=UPI002FC60379
MRLIEVRPENQELIEKIVENENDTFSGIGNADMWLIKSIIRYGKLYVLLNQNNELLSVAQYMPIFGKDEVFLYGFSTVNKHQKKGHGKKLLLESEKELKDLGIKKVILTVAPENSSAIKLYEGTGYSVTELQKNEYGLGIDRYVMEKNL